MSNTNVEVCMKNIELRDFVNFIYFSYFCDFFINFQT